MKKLLPLILIVVYALIHTFIREYVLFVEFAYALAVLFILKDRVKFKFAADRFFAALVVAFPFLGILIFEGMNALRLPQPFDMSTPFGILLLIFVGPIVEELLFRGAFWAILKKIFDKDIYVVMAVTLIFFSFMKS